MIRLPLAFTVAISLVAAPSITFADTPSPPNADIPCGINLVGMTGGSADVKGEFLVIIRNIANDPVEGSHIVVDFSACTPDIRISAVQPWPGVSVDCSGSVVEAISDANGKALMRIVGGANNSAAGTPAAGADCAKIYADGVLLGSVTIGAYDQNGGSGVSPADFSVWLTDAFDDDYEGRSDFNCTGTINVADFSVLLGVSLGAGSLQSAASYCN